MNKFKTISFIIAVALFSSCNNDISTNSNKIEFDISKFINSETQRLQNENPTITKTVINGKSQETKRLTISNWSKELNNFSTIDLNINSKQKFIKSRIKDTVLYRSDEAQYNILTVKIVYKDSIPNDINIVKRTKNLLFENEEYLQYSKDKSYSISKKQYVKGLGSNNYIIKGEF